MSIRSRLKRIIEFRQELRTLGDEGVVDSSDPTIRAIEVRHDEIIAAAAEDEGIDLNREEARLSAGMRLATLLGAMALSIAWSLFVSSVWDDLGQGAKLLLVWFPPFLLVAGTEYSIRREATGYVANILATVGSIAIAVAAIATVDLYEFEPSRAPFFIVGVYALVLAYRYRLAMPLLIGVAGLGGWIWSLASVIRGDSYQQAFEYAEPAALVGAGILAVGMMRTRDPVEFRFLLRLGGAVAICWSLLVLGVAKETSILGPVGWVEGFYQVVAALVFVAMVWYGLRSDDEVLSKTGGVALVLYLLFRMIDWFWDAVPDWLFFLMMGVIAFAVLLGLRRIRIGRRDRGGGGPVNLPR